MTVWQQRRLEWEAERRFLTREKHRVERRLEELDELLRILAPREAA